jgi:hypothetical protein
MSQATQLSADFRNYLEDLVVTRKPCFVQFRKDGDVLAFEARITDLYTEEETEYLELEGGIRVALPDLVDIDGFNFGRLV